ncbi:hypothetical protein KCU74_g43, partial [Aureobasidium melanogenum]
MEKSSAEGPRENEGRVVVSSSSASWNEEMAPYSGVPFASTSSDTHPPMPNNDKGHVKEAAATVKKPTSLIKAFLATLKGLTRAMEPATTAQRWRKRRDCRSQRLENDCAQVDAEEVASGYTDGTKEETKPRDQGKEGDWLGMRHRAIEERKIRVEAWVFGGTVDKRHDLRIIATDLLIARRETANISAVKTEQREQQNSVDERLRRVTTSMQAGRGVGSVEGQGSMIDVRTERHQDAKTITSKTMGGTGHSRSARSIQDAALAMTTDGNQSVAVQRSGCG